MEVLILLAIIFTYSSLSSKINDLANSITIKNKKKLPSLQKLIGQNIEIETDDYIDLSTGSNPQGILKEYNDTWIVIEITNNKELYYYRINNITSINIINNN